MKDQINQTLISSSVAPTNWICLTWCTTFLNVLQIKWFSSILCWAMGTDIMFFLMYCLMMIKVTFSSKRLFKDSQVNNNFFSPLQFLRWHHNVSQWVNSFLHFSHLNFGFSFNLFLYYVECWFLLCLWTNCALQYWSHSIVYLTKIKNKKS